MLKAVFQFLLYSAEVKRIRQRLLGVCLMLVTELKPNAHNHFEPLQ